MFKEDYKTGRLGEQQVKELFDKAGLASFFNTNRRQLSDFDLTTRDSGIQFTTEVKFDEKSSDTGNIVVEVRNTGRNSRPSGLCVTKADLWAQVLTDSVWLASVDTLKDFIANTPPSFKMDNAGDGNAAIFVYKDYDILPTVFRRIDNLSIRELRNVVCQLLK